MGPEPTKQVMGKRKTPEGDTALTVPLSRSKGRPRWSQGTWDDQANLCHCWRSGVLETTRGKRHLTTARWRAALSSGVGICRGVSHGNGATYWICLGLL